MTMYAELLASESDIVPVYAADIDDIGLVLLDRYSVSEHGQWQATQPLRYVSGFGSYGREQMLADLGSDIHPLQHMPATDRSLLALLAGEGESGEWSPADVSIGRTAALLHDIGECTHPQLADVCGAVVGDIPQGRKTDEQRVAEAKVRERLYRLYCADMPDDYLERVEACIAHQEDSPIHRGLEAVHDVNTFRIGLRAGRIVLSSPETSIGSGRVEQLRIMAKAVTAGVLERVEHHASEFAYPAVVLDRSLSLYERIQSTL